MGDDRGVDRRGIDAPVAVHGIDVVVRRFSEDIAELVIALADQHVHLDEPFEGADQQHLGGGRAEYGIVHGRPAQTCDHLGAAEQRNLLLDRQQFGVHDVEAMALEYRLYFGLVDEASTLNARTGDEYPLWQRGAGAVSKPPDRLKPLGGFADISLFTPLLIDEIQQLRRGPRVA